jgi:hypothetical protein
MKTSVGIATDYGDRIPVGSRFFPSVQNSPGGHPASCKMGTESLPGVKRPGRGTDHPPSSSAEVKKIVELCLYSPFGPSGLFGGTVTFYLYPLKYLDSLHQLLTLSVHQLLLW